MAKDQTKRIEPKILESDKYSAAALQKLNDYNPPNAKYSLDKTLAALKEMTAKQETEAQAWGAYQAARDKANDAEWAFHNLILGVKEQVIAIYGKDSDEVQSLGLKKKSEYKKPKRKTAK